MRGGVEHFGISERMVGGGGVKFQCHPWWKECSVEPI